MTSFDVLRSAQTRRAIALPAQFTARAPAREATLEGFRQRNAVLDYIFYNLRALSAAEATDLADHYAAEGAILAVGPSAAPSLARYASFAEFAAEGLPDHATIVVAGVGSSALGAAAFARDVADAIGEPVLAVVSGYGLADLLTEAIGGAFLFGALNSLRTLFEPLDDFTTHRFDFAGTSLPAAEAGARASYDVRTLVALLGSGLKVDRLIGHSKGNLVISEALYALGETAPARSATLAREAWIVTISAAITMPDAFRDVTDIMGQFDGFGAMNSRPSIRIDHWVSGAWHHTNTELTLPLRPVPVTETLRAVMKARAAAPI